MNIKTLALIGLIIPTLASTKALAGESARPGTNDPRVKTFTYSENEVFRINGHYGFSSVIEFSAKERVETISIGDSESWQIVKPNRPNILFIKPLEKMAETNMTVLTNKRIYTFELSAKRAASYQDSDLSFRLKFIYPGETDMELANIGTMRTGNTFSPLLGSSAADLNFEYSYSGSKRLRPEKVFDDGEFTYFQFEDFDVMPAIFAVDEQGFESLVNYNVQGQYLVVTNTGRQFTLRDGDSATCIFNETYPANPGIQKSIAPVAQLKKRKVPLPSHKPDIEKLKLAQTNTSFFDDVFSLFDDFTPSQTANMNE